MLTVIPTHAPALAAQGVCDARQSSDAYGPVRLTGSKEPVTPVDAWKLEWHSGRAGSLPPCSPAFLVISPDRPVQFSGKGFMAFTAKSPKPFAITLFPGADSAFVPLNYGTFTQNGEIELLPANAGALTVRWQAVAIDPVSHRPILIAGSSGQTSINVFPAAPSITVDDPTSCLANRGDQYCPRTGNRF
jgi:hypothetical protein